MIKYADNEQAKFLMEMAECQITAREFFADVLSSLNKDLGMKEVLISYFDTCGKFLSWVNWDGVSVDFPEHPYRKFIANDVVRSVIYQDAVRNRLTYFNTKPCLYKATDVIDSIDYERSAYVRFLEENFHQHYCVTMAFGINAYIQVSFFKSFEEGDFESEEIQALNKLYVYIANSYKNFKKHEQSKIVSKLQSEIISSGEKAYLVTDAFMHVMSYNKTAQSYLEDIMGPCVDEQINSDTPCSWLFFLFGSEETNSVEGSVQTRVFKHYIFNVHTYDQTYSNGIVDRYHWISISRTDEGKFSECAGEELPLTPTEQKVAALMYHGLTYKAIADEMVISYHTVKKHMQNIYTKCGVNSRYQLYKWLESREL